MITKEFISLLKENPKKELVFEYAKAAFVPASYHITEIKNIHMRSVDCGGNMHEEHQTVVQLWIPGSEETDTHLLSEKALKIFDIVNGKVALKQDTEIFFEYGHKNLPTSVYKVEAIQQEEDRLVLQLFVPATACKPKLNLSSLPCVPSGNNSCC